MSKNNHRILVYRNRLLPISETFIYNQSVNLNKYQAFFLGAKQQNGAKITLPADRVQLVNNGGIIGFLREFFFKVCGVIPEDTLNWIRTIEPQLIHAHFGDDGTIIMPLLSKLNIPFVVSILGTDITLKDEYARKSYFRQRLFLLRRSRLVDQVTKIVVPSEFLKNKAMEHGFPEKKIRVIHHGIDTSIFSPQNNTPDYFKILFVGRLIPRKGLNYLINAIGLLKREFPSVFLTVIGDGPFRREYELQAKAILKDGFEFLGFQSQADIRVQMKKSYLFSMPSTTMASGETETFGLVFIEALAMGVPVVCFNSGGIPEVVAHNETGLLSKEGNVDELAENLKRLFRDEFFRNKLGIAARKRVLKMFDLKKQNEELENLYDELIS